MTEKTIGYCERCELFLRPNDKCRHFYGPHWHACPRWQLGPCRKTPCGPATYMDRMVNVMGVYAGTLRIGERFVETGGIEWTCTGKTCKYPGGILAMDDDVELT